MTTRKTYIKNKGITHTFFQDNHHHKNLANEIKWDADYNGKVANIKVDIENNGKKNKYRMQMNNKDLANLLRIPAVNQPLEQRLKNDFLNDDNDFTDDDMDFLIPQLQESEPELQLEPIRLQIAPQQQMVEPEPILFRINIPNKTYPRPSTRPSPSIRHRKELSSLPDLTSLVMSPFDSLTPVVTPGINPFSLLQTPPKKLTKRERNARLKTPSPKTMRIHFTDTASGIKPRRKTRKAKGKLGKFFNKFFKP